MLKGAKMKKRMKQSKAPAGMCPNMTVERKKPRKKPNPYRAPITVKRYYSGIHYGIDTLKEDLCSLIEDEDIKTLIKERAKAVKVGASKKLTEMEKAKTKQKLKEWEEKEWESI